MCVLVRSCAFTHVWAYVHVLLSVIPNQLSDRMNHWLLIFLLSLTLKTLPILVVHLYLNYLTPTVPK